ILYLWFHRPTKGPGLASSAGIDGRRRGDGGATFSQRERRAPVAATHLERFPIRLTNLPRHGRARPGHPRLVCGTIDVDARNKSGHDGGGFGSTISENALIPQCV